MTNFNDELSKILEDLCQDVFSGGNPGEIRKIDDILNPAISAITELVKGIVPKEKDENIEGNMKEQNICFNSCRSEILKGLE